MFAKATIASALVAALVGGVSRPSDSADVERYTVRPGDTLWTIAVRHYDGDPREAVWHLRERNGEAADVLEPGQTLLLP